MRKSFLTIICCVLLLTMLAVPLFAVASTGDAEPQASGEKTYQQVVGYDSATLWKSTIRDNDWGCANKSDNDGWTGTVMWSKGTYTYAADTKVLTLAPIKPGYAFQFHPYRSYSAGFSSTKIMEGALAFSASFDMLYDPATFEGIAIAMNNASVFCTIDENGAASIAGAEGPQAVGTLTEGWNTIRLYYIANVEGGNIASFNIYAELNGTYGTAAIPASAITSLPYTTWSSTGLVENDFIMVQFSSVEGSEATNANVSFRNFLVTKMNAPDTTLSFGGVAPDMLVESGIAITLPTTPLVEAWLLNGERYEPGSQFLVEGDVAFTPVIDAMLYQTIGYDSASFWKDSVQDNNWGCNNKSDNGGWTGAVLWFKEYAYDAASKELTLVTQRSGGNSMQIAPYRTWTAGYVQNDDTTHLLKDARMFYTSFDFKYVPTGFTGFQMEGIFTVGANGTVKTNTGNVVGTMTEGWNNFKVYFYANYDTDNAIKNWTTYIALNETAVTYPQNPATMLANASGTWSNKALTHDTYIRVTFSDANATADAPLSYTFRNFTTATLTARTLAELADEALPELTYAVVTATAETIVEKALALKAALENPILDTTTANYIAATGVLETALTDFENSITTYLTPVAGETLEDHFDRLLEAIKAYQATAALIGDETRNALIAAIDNYNAIVDEVNADVVEATTVAVSASVYKFPNTEILVILADIKSKIED